MMTTRSCNFDKSQYCQLQMGYHQEIEQQVHLLEKNPLGTSSQMLVKELLNGHLLLIDYNNSSRG